jgi:hypothetical protein
MVCGSAAAIAQQAGSRAFSAEVLLRYVRGRLWKTLHDGTPESVVPTLDLLRSLEIVFFLDPSAASGMWLDVDPDSQIPVGVQLIRADLSTSPLGRFTVFAR